MDGTQLATIDCQSSSGLQTGQVLALTQLGAGSHTLTVSGVADAYGIYGVILDAYRTY